MPLLALVAVCALWWAVVVALASFDRRSGFPDEREIQRRIESWREITGRDLTHEVAKQRREMGL